MKRIINTKQFAVALMLVAAAGFALRWYSGLELRRVYPPVTQPSEYTDMYTYQKLAKEILVGDYDYDNGFYYQPFYYAVFLPALYKVAGDGPGAVIFIQSLLGTITIVLTGLAFALLFGRITGIVAATLTAVSRMLIFYTPFTLVATLQAFWMALFTYVVVIAARKPAPWQWGIVGFVNGCAILTRGNALLFVPLVFILLLSLYRGARRSLAIAAVTYIVAAILPTIPFAVINFRSSQHQFATSIAGPAVLALGNTPESPPGGRSPGTGPGPMEYPESCEEWTRLAYAEPPDQISIWQHIGGWVRHEPAAFLELKFRMLLLFWNSAEVPNNVALTAFGRSIPARIINFSGLLDFNIIGVLGLAGLLLALIRQRHRRSVLFAGGLVVIYCFATLLFYILARFRLPVLPLLCGFGGYFFTASLDALLRRRRQHRLRNHPLLLTGIFVACGVFVVSGFDLYRHNLEAGILRRVRPRGVTIQLSDKMLIKDHGPQSFGGWLPYQLGANLGVTKRFLLPTSGSTQIGRDWQIRFPVVADTATRLEVAISSPGGAIQVRRNLELKPGFQWLDIQGDEFQLDLSAGDVEIKLEFVVESAAVSLVFDAQRDYGRSLIDGSHSLDFGEMVIELLLFK